MPAGHDTTLERFSPEFTPLPPTSPRRVGPGGGRAGLEWKAFSEFVGARRVRRRLARRWPPNAATGDGTHYADRPGERARAPRARRRRAANGAGGGAKGSAGEDANSKGAGVDDDPGADAMSLREAVEAFAQANDLTFMPEPGRQHEGLQVYSSARCPWWWTARAGTAMATGWAPASLDTSWHTEKAGESA